MNGRHVPAQLGQNGGPPPHQQTQHHQETGRRRQYNNQHQHQHHLQYPPQPANHMYNNNYINPYAGYYNQMQYAQAPQYQPNGMAPNPYAPYPAYARSPPPQYPPQYQQPPPPQVVSSYPAPRPHQPPVIASTPTQPPTHTPSSSQSTHANLADEQSQNTPVQDMSTVLGNTSLNEVAPPSPAPFRAPLPWLSRPDLQWPAATKRGRRRRRIDSENAVDVKFLQLVGSDAPTHSSVDEEHSKALRSDTPSSVQLPSEENASTTPTTPSSVQPSTTSPTPQVVVAKTAPKIAPIPIIPAIPKTSSRAPPAIPAPEQQVLSKIDVNDSSASPIVEQTSGDSNPDSSEAEVKTPPVAAGPKTWSGLFKGGPMPTIPAKNGAATSPTGQPITGVLRTSNNESLAEALRMFSATAKDAKLAFLKPRGLINTGNMCYMNSVLQVLIFCIPFYDFLDLVGKRATHSFKSDTPLIDAMILFMREFPVIDFSTSVEKLRMRLKDSELEQYGDAFTPDFIYNVVSALPRFATMRRGHQQDAEEFLGFLLDGLHEECVKVMQSTGSSDGGSEMPTPTNAPASPASEHASVVTSTSIDNTNGWMEVGPKQRTAITRSSGTILIESPVTKIFGGTLRSELRVRGTSDSVTKEPFQPLQLDIGSPQVNNITDALKGITRPETLHGDFKSRNGPNTTATKQVMIETLPPVLILHLKRFQYDNTGGTQKIWKKIGYPLELEIPKEIFSRKTLASLPVLPKYRLIAVVYHHGMSASGGHYTVDVRRQDGREWVRLDDTVIRRVRSEDVAEAGSEEHPRVIAAALEAHKKQMSSSDNMFSKIDLDQEEEEGEEWKQVNGNSSTNTGTKKWSSVVNGSGAAGAATPKGSGGKTPKSIKDKVAYLLFYQRI